MLLKHCGSVDNFTRDAENRHKSEVTLKNACMEFEALLLSHMLKSMRKATASDVFSGDSDESRLERGQAGQMIREMFDENLGLEVAQKGGIGLAELLFRQMKERL